MDLAVAEPTKKKSKAPDKWEVENWANTMLEAEKIKGDPEKMKHVMPHLHKTAKAITSMTQLRAHAKEMHSKAAPEGDASGDS